MDEARLSWGGDGERAEYESCHLFCQRTFHLYPGWFRESAEPILTRTR